MLCFPFYLMISLVVGFTTIAANNSSSHESSQESSPEQLQVIQRAVGVVKGRCYEGQYLKHDTSCFKYYSCQNKRFVERKCDFGIWNNRKERCEFSDTCLARTDNMWHSKGIPDCTKTKKIYHRHPFDCSKFYKCINTKLVERSCRNGGQINLVNESCERLFTCEVAKPKPKPKVPLLTRRMQLPNNSEDEEKSNKKKNCNHDDDIDDDDDDNDSDDYY